MAGLKQPRRNWDQAHEKAVNEGGRCRVCRSNRMVQLAHVTGREHDKHAPLVVDNWPWKPYWVSPDRVVPLCGPANDPKSCHGRYDAGLLDLLPYLTLHEVLQAVADSASGGENGLENARMRLCPTAYRVPADWEAA